MTITIQQVQSTLPQQIAELGQQAKQDGFDFVERLIEEYEAGKNRFDRVGETLLAVYDEDKLIACGGLNQQIEQHEPNTRIGYIQYCYVMPEYRKTGVGRQLLATLEMYARPYFAALCLQTETTSAATFYQKLNYVFVANHPSYNYFKYLI